MSRVPRKHLAAVLLLMLAGLLTLPIGAASAGDTVLTYSVKESRAYAFKVSVSKEAVEGVGTASPCSDKPQTAYDDCDGQVYNHTLNCPIPPGIGRAGADPRITPPPGTPAAGGAGDGAGDTNPPQSTPIRLHDVVTQARLGRLGTVLESGGFASKRYVDLDGRQVPEAHTESDAFSPNRSDYEERCYTSGTTGDFQLSANYAHLFSRSAQTPGTFHFAECQGSECRFATDQCGGGQCSPAQASKAQTFINLYEHAGMVHGKLLSTIDGFSQGGAFAAESIVTYLTFSSDGTKNGLSWSAMSVASGVKFVTPAGDVPISLPAGALLASPACSLAPDTAACFSVGTAAPYVKSTPDGKQLTMVAPGLVVATQSQTFYYAGAEVLAGFDRASPVQTFDPPPPIGTITTGGTSFIPGAGASEILPVAPSSVPRSDEPVKRTVAISQTDADPLPVIVILGLSAGAFLLLMGGWMQRFDWAQRAYRAPPLRFMFWVWRAFVKT